jgi:hypothetical protein
VSLRKHLLIDALNLKRKTTPISEIRLQTGIAPASFFAVSNRYRDLRTKFWRPIREIYISRV